MGTISLIIVAGRLYRPWTLPWRQFDIFVKDLAMFPKFSPTVITGALPCTAIPILSQLFFLIGGEGYKSSVRHYLESSCEIAMAAVQPGRVEDLSMIVSIFVHHSPKCRLLIL
jgi:hypothetical protein